MPFSVKNGACTPAAIQIAVRCVYVLVQIGVIGRQSLWTRPVFAPPSACICRGQLNGQIHVNMSGEAAKRRMALARAKEEVFQQRERDIVAYVSVLLVFARCTFIMDRMVSSPPVSYCKYSVGSHKQFFVML